MIEDTKIAIKNDDIVGATNELNNVYWCRYLDNPKKDTPEEELKIIIDYLHSKLKAIADKHNILAEVPQEVAKIRDDYAKYVLMQKTDENGNYHSFITNIFHIANRYISTYMSNLEELFEVVENTDLKSPRELLEAEWKDLDEKYPMDKPCLISKNNIDDFSDDFEDSEYEDKWISFDDEDNSDNLRLETEEEVRDRIAKMQEERQKRLASVEGVDNREKFENWWNFISVLPSLSNLYADMKNAQSFEAQKVRAKALQAFKDGKEFYRQLNEIMAHDSENEIFWFHGTQCVEDAESIMKTGLLMASDEMSKTAYPEFTPDDALEYSRGFCGEIGRDAIVIIRQPLVDDGNGKKVPLQIIQENNTDISVCQSGLGGMQERLGYWVSPEYIVGYINKRDHTIVWNKEFFMGE